MTARADSTPRALQATRTMPDPARRRPPGSPEPVDVQDRRELSGFLDRFARAFADGDLAAIADLHATPVLVVTEEEATTFDTTTEIADGFRSVVAEHRRRGLVSNSYRVEALKTLTPALHEVSVRWTYHDENGRPRFHDSYRYLLRRVPGQGLRIGVVMVLGGPVAENS